MLKHLPMSDVGLGTIQWSVKTGIELGGKRKAATDT